MASPFFSSTALFPSFCSCFFPLTPVTDSAVPVHHAHAAERVKRKLIGKLMFIVASRLLFLKIGFLTSLFTLPSKIRLYNAVASLFRLNLDFRWNPWSSCRSQNGKKQSMHGYMEQIRFSFSMLHPCAECGSWDETISCPAARTTWVRTGSSWIPTCESWGVSHW